MKAKLIVAAFTFVTGFSMYAIAEEQEKHINVLHTEGAKMVMINIDKDDDGEAKVDLKINGESYSFDLPELADGEVREIITADGQTIKLIKAEKGTNVNIDGEEILLHSLDGLHTIDGASHGRIAKIFALKGMGAGVGGDNIVITGSGLDADARARIKDAIVASGVEKKVIFMDTKMQWFGDEGSHEIEIEIDGDNDGEEKHRVIMIKKQLHVDTEEN